MSEISRPLHEVKTTNYRLLFRADGIQEIHVLNGTIVTVEMIREMNEQTRKFGNGARFPNLIHIHGNLNADHKVRAFAASEEANLYTLADAFMITSTALKVIGNFYLRVNKPVRPTRMFTSETDAVEWLLSFLKK